MATLSDAHKLADAVKEREEQIQTLLEAAGIRVADDITLMALLAIIHLTLASASLHSADFEPTFRLAEEILEAKK